MSILKLYPKLDLSASGCSPLFFSKETSWVRRSFFLVLFLFLICNLSPGNVLAQSQTLELEAGVMTNGASVQDCSSCSGSKQVGNLGGNTNGAVSQQVTVAQAGDYDLVLSYSTGDPRSIYLTVNNQPSVEIACQPSGGWT